MEPLDSNWLTDHPLPEPGAHADKNARGRVFIVGGCARVPGGLLLTAEAALRVGAGKVQVATTASTALALGIAMPEIAVFPVAEDDEGEITCLQKGLDEFIARCDAVVVGPAMSGAKAAGDVVDGLLAKDHPLALILDAAALMDLPARAAALAARAQPAVLTPHIGEMAAMLECDAAEIEADRAAAVRRAAERYGAVVMLKGSTSLVADAGGALFAYAGGGVGLATGGSGDVLAGIAAGLAARGAPPLEAALWAVWLHGEAGRRCAAEIGPLGFLARELLRHVPGLMQTV
ncbi:MAG: NAD(P)H-hydrate dehydratase [Sphingomonadales bacterium]|nr:NAD(P)H-hydrate dehydratase [Sphingomonadales bacterium]